MNTPENFLNKENDSLDIVKEIRYYTFFWPWFLVTVLMFSFGAYLHLRYASNVYKTSATLQVKDASSDPSSFLTRSSGSLIDFGRVKIDNFITQLGSKINFAGVVDVLDLQTRVYSVGRIKQKLQFGEDIPFKIDFKNQIADRKSVV